ncbi:hypothetical protein GVO57_14345 (plasmid) [Sphingomonas changnyeongensis]|uniref:Uncharacterized protein n=1 Tax=Sphingomonas changnyeongensis TaxID=2698679 RepID=A0A7Z2NYA7_9SPHN|nr:hypothetical protein [Sphingomonas changnyeongensis]QHL92060.1 hypothetical protein GVO57_14345 [Sphingomonas changnyeongensis]
MMNLLTNTLLRKVPDHLMSGVMSGEYRVYGSILRSVTSGQIVGHLQETSRLSSLLTSSPLDVPGLAFEAVNIVQNEQIKSALSLMQSLQIANIALSGISIGVSIAGTALLMRRISQVEQKIDAILPSISEIAKGVEALKTSMILDDFTRLRTLASQVEEAWLPSASQSEWTAIARDSHFLADSFERRAREIGSAGDHQEIEPFLDAYALASGLRITARLAAGQDDIARQAATTHTHTLVALGGSLRLDRMTLASMKRAETAATPEWQEKANELADKLRSTVRAARARELAAASCAETLYELDRQEISGREWLEASRDESTSPILFLPVRNQNGS